MIPGLIVVLLLGLAAPFEGASAQDAETLKIRASDGAAGDRFGAAIASTDRYVVVAAPDATVNGNARQGAAYVFERRDCLLVEVAKLVAGDGGAAENFGSSVAISQDMILVGATGATVDGQSGRGAVYIFTRDGNRWTQSDKLSSRDGLVTDRFGASVATDGRRIVVGAPSASGGFGPPGSYRIGAAYVFEEDDGEWEQEQRLTAMFEQFNAEFGATLAMDGDRMVIGAPAFQDHNGIVFVYERDDGEWEARGYLLPRPGGPASRIGAALAMHDKRFIVGAPGNETRDTFMSGVLHVFEWDGDDPDQEADLVASDWSAGAAFGSTGAIAKDLVAASAPGEETVHVFDRRGDDWNEIARVVAPAGQEKFGSALAIAERLLVVGASGSDGSRGAIYVYAVDNG